MNDALGLRSSGRRTKGKNLHTTGGAAGGGRGGPRSNTYPKRNLVLTHWYDPPGRRISRRHYAAAGFAVAAVHSCSRSRYVFDLSFLVKCSRITIIRLFCPVKPGGGREKSCQPHDHGTSIVLYSYEVRGTMNRSNAAHLGPGQGQDQYSTVVIKVVRISNCTVLYHAWEYDE